MNGNDPLLRLLTEFFELPAGTLPADIRQQLLPAWDSLATVQLITDLERAFSVSFGIEEIVRLRSYQEIRDALRKQGVHFDNSPVQPDQIS